MFAEDYLAFYINGTLVVYYEDTEGILFSAPTAALYVYGYAPVVKDIAFSTEELTDLGGEEAAA